MRRSITTKTGSQVELTDAQLEVMARRLQQKAWALHSECEPNGEDAKVLEDLALDGPSTDPLVDMEAALKNTYNPIARKRLGPTAEVSLADLLR